jgi:transmembrane sensor
MQDSQEIQRIREATDIFLRLRDNPEDPKLLRERDRFLARGAPERAAYKKMLQVWSVTGAAKRAHRPTIAPVLVAGVVAVAGYFTFAAHRYVFTADGYTRFETQAHVLETGDQIVLDAQSAFANNSGAEERHIRLLQGAAFFDVEPEARPFVVTAGDVRVEVTGTAFEVGSDDSGGVVSVEEGSVTVRINARSWDLRPGDRLRLTDEGAAQLTRFDPTRAASWRRDLLVSDGMTLAEIVDVLNRRLPGEIVVTHSALAATKIVGTFDLSEPRQSLDLLMELTGAQVISVPYVMAVIVPKS